MLNINGSKYISVFDLDDKGNYIQANLTTSKKNKDGSYTNMYWRARFVGQAYEKAKNLKSKNIIEITNGGIENTYDKENQKLYVTVVIFDFNKMNK